MKDKSHKKYLLCKDEQDNRQNFSYKDTSLLEIVAKYQGHFVYYTGLHSQQGIWSGEERLEEFGKTNKLEH